MATNAAMLVRVTAVVVVMIVLCGAAAAETCIGNSTYADWNDDNVLSGICADAVQAVMSQRNSTTHYFRTAVELPETANAEAAALTLTATDSSGEVHSATATAEQLIVTVCFSTNETFSSVDVSANEEYLEERYLRYAFYFDEVDNSSCPAAPTNQIYDYISSAQDGPDDGDCICNDHGTCSDVENYCDCDEGWFGLQCQLYCTREETCNGLGRCHRPDARCQCDDCYFGDSCEFVDPECLVLLPTPAPIPECVCDECDTSMQPMTWRSLLFFIVCIGIVVILTAMCLIYVVIKKIRRITEKKDYLPASILDEEEIDW